MEFESEEETRQFKVANNYGFKSKKFLSINGTNYFSLDENL